jgi:predicted transcriptional regulator
MVLNIRVSDTSVNEMVRDLLTKEFTTVQHDDTVSRKIKNLNDYGTVCVMDGEKFVGLLDPHQFLRSRVDTTALKVSTVTMHVPQLRLQDDPLQVASAFYDSGTTLLPVIEQDKLIGVVHISKVLSAITPRLKDVKISDIKHPAPIVVLESERLDTAINLMHDEHIDHLAVLDAQGKLSGVINHMSLINTYYAHAMARDEGMRPGTRTRAFRPDQPDIPGLQASNFMSAAFTTLTEEDTAAHAAQKMIEANTIALFILDEGMPTGIVTQRELLEAAIHHETPENMNIQYVGLEELNVDTYVKMQLKKIVSRHAGKLDYYFNNEFQLIVHIKEYSKSGERHKYSVHLRAVYPGAVVPSSEGHAWNARSAIQEAFKRLLSELEHSYTQELKGRHSIRTASIQGASAKRMQDF